MSKIYFLAKDGEPVQPNNDTDAPPRHIIEAGDEEAHKRADMHCQMMHAPLYGTLVEVRHD